MDRTLKFTFAILLGALVGGYLVPRLDAWRRPPVQADPRPVAPRGDLGVDEKATIDVFRKASPAVVFITTRANRRLNLFSRDVTEVAAGEGSGFIWDEHGHVVTNYHVLDVQGATRYVVTLSDQSSYEAEWVGGSEAHDLAVLRIDAPLAAGRLIDVGTSHDLLVGQKVYAIGNPFGWDQSLSTGVVSAVGRTIRGQSGRPIEDVIQTDAAINPGNSGGPLLDSAGRLIGVNTAIYSPSGSSAGVGFAIPVDTVNHVVPQLIRNGFLVRPVIGIRVDEDVSRQITAQLRVEGLAVARVDADSGAAEAGMRGLAYDEDGKLIVGDIIQQIGGTRIRRLRDLYVALEDRQPGEEVEVICWRNGRVETYRVRLQAPPRNG